MEKLKVTIGNAVLPYVTRLTQKLSDWLQKGANQKKINGIVNTVGQLGHQFVGVARNLTPLVKSLGNFVRKNPDLVRMIGYAIALKGAAKLISFATPIRSLGRFAWALRGLLPLGKRVGAALVARFAAEGAASGAAFGAAFAAAMPALILAAGAALAYKLPSLLKGAIGNKDSAGSLQDMLGQNASPDFGGYAQWKKSHPGGTRAQFFRWNREQQKGGFLTGNLNNAFAVLSPSNVSKVMSGPFTMPSALPSFTAGGGGVSQNTSRASKKRKAGAPKVTPEEALHEAFKLRHWAHPYRVRLARISIHDHSLAANRRRKMILTSGISVWKGTRSELKRLANDAHKGGDAEIFGQIWDIIHDGDAMVAKWKAKLAAVQDSISIASSQEAIDNANRKLAIAQDTAASETAFLRAALGFGDIGTGGINALQAAGGAPNKLSNTKGGNVHITINSLHPGDAKTKKAIASAVTTALGMQGSVSSSRAAA